ncbi:MAG: ABC transporter permease [Bacteroidetes bacterium]|nr:ABC transporter permease [Bacteroidota bacterium]
MFFTILKFELRYRFKRPATYIYFAILFFMAFLFLTTDVVQIGGGNGNVFRNSPFTINQAVLILGVFSTMICSALMGVPVFRDFDNKFHEIYFTTPIKKSDYLFGRFVGSFIITVFVFSGMLWGIFIGSIMPFQEPDQIAKFQLMSYLQPLLTISIPNILFTGAIFFSIGSLTRNLFAIYVQGILFLILWVISQTFTKDIDNQMLAALIDPMGVGASRDLTKFWTPAEKNTLMVPLSGALFYNRILWSSIGAIIFAIGYKLFSFSAQPISFFKRKKANEETSLKTGKIVVPLIKPEFTFATAWAQLRSIARFESKLILKSAPFLVIMIFGVFNLIGNLLNQYELPGTSQYPVTSIMVEAATQSFALFYIIIITFYVGELVWRERGNKMEQIADSLPIGNYTLLFGKFIAMLLVLVIISCVVMLSSMLVQVIKGYTHFEIPLYLKYLFVVNFQGYILLVMLAFFVHTLVNNKFMGHALVILYYIINIALEANGFTNNLYYFNRTPSFTLSDMNGFGHFLTSVKWFSIYWFFFACILLVFASILWIRGSESSWKARFKIAGNRFNAQNKLLISTCLLLFFLCGGFIYYNTSRLNHFIGPKEMLKMQANAERKYKRYSNTPQPRIYAINNNVDIFPVERKVTINGSYWMHNINKIAVDTIIYNLTEQGHIENKKISFSVPVKNILSDDSMGFYLCKLEKPMLPGDSMLMRFEYSIAFHGFANDNSGTGIVENGSFINSAVFPMIGYQPEGEISDVDDRKKNNLPKRPRSYSIYDSTKYNNNYINNDADFVTFETTVSTSGDQLAIAPGYLQRQWREQGRNYFHYKMDSKIVNFYSYLSARYEVKRDVWKDPKQQQEPVNIEIYYHKGHEYNLDVMVKAIKKSLDYFTENFGPYQHKQARIIEFPRYATFAQSFPNTIPYSEGIGFILKIDEEKAIDMVYYVTSHEMAHQWWGHQVVGCPVDGMTTFSESMAQYSALLVMEKEYGKAEMKRFLKYELSNYLRSRGREKEKEQPLLFNQNQQYLHYRKGSVVMYALQDYIGEKNVNTAMKKFIEKYKFQGPPYPTALDFYGFIERETPDSLKSFVNDLFKKITLYSNECTAATVSSGPAKDYKVKITVTAQKFYADSVGNETKVKMNDWVDIGAVDENDKLIYSKRVRITKSPMDFEFTLAQKPAKAGIDPMNKLIDRDTDDNLKKVD